MNFASPPHCTMYGPCGILQSIDHQRGVEKNLEFYWLLRTKSEKNKKNDLFPDFRGSLVKSNIQ